MKLVTIAQMRDVEKEADANGFSGKLTNGENIDKTSDELAALWNGNHPEDLIPLAD